MLITGMAITGCTNGKPIEEERIADDGAAAFFDVTASNAESFMAARSGEVGEATGEAVSLRIEEVVTFSHSVWVFYSLVFDDSNLSLTTDSVISSAIDLKRNDRSGSGNTAEGTRTLSIDSETRTVKALFYRIYEQERVAKDDFFTFEIRKVSVDNHTVTETGAPLSITWKAEKIGESKEFEKKQNNVYYTGAVEPFVLILSASDASADMSRTEKRLNPSKIHLLDQNGKRIERFASTASGRGGSGGYLIILFDQWLDPGRVSAVQVGVSRIISFKP